LTSTMSLGMNRPTSKTRTSPALTPNPYRPRRPTPPSARAALEASYATITGPDG
jgi:hypothetical protein